MKNPTDLFRVSKAIDGYAEENSFILTACRVDAHHGDPARALFYDLTFLYDDLILSVQLNQRLIDLGVPRSRWRMALVGIPFYPSGFAAPKGRLELPRPREVEVGGHCVVVVSWNDQGDLLFPNTWGPAWGDGGWGALSPDYVGTLLREAWISWDARFGITQEKATRLEAANKADDDKAFGSIWAEETKSFRQWVRHGRKRVRARLLDTLSLDGRPAELLELRDRVGTLVAWTHLIYMVDPPTVEVREFYVWPAFRRQGLGSLLCELILERGQGYGADAVVARVYQPDALPAFQEGLEKFISSVGFELSWDLCRNPILVARAHRNFDRSAT